MDIDPPCNNEPTQPVATSVLSVNVSESEGACDSDASIAVVSPKSRTGKMLRIVKSGSEFEPNGDSDNTTNSTDSDDELQFSGHDGGEEPGSHSDQHRDLSPGHSSSTVVPSQPVRSKPNATAALISTPNDTPTDAADTGGTDFWNAATDTLFTDGDVSERVDQH